MRHILLNEKAALYCLFDNSKGRVLNTLDLIYKVNSAHKRINVDHYPGEIKELLVGFFLMFHSLL